MKAQICALLTVALAGCAQTARTAAPPASAQPPANATASAPTPGTAKPTPPVQATAKSAPPATNQTAPPAAPKTQIATAADGTKIAFEVAGSGPPLLLVHGGGQTRKSWGQIGYVDRLSKRFTVIALDLRGFGESDRPLGREAYALDRVIGDLLAVADAAKTPRFHLWGFGQGATIARYLAARSDRVISAVLVGATMGPPVSGVFKEAISGMRTRWQPAIDAHAAGNLEAAKLSASDRAAWDGGMGLTVFSLGAMLDYPPLEPGEIKVPTLWVIGADDSVIENVKEYEAKLKGSNVTLKIVSSVNYSDSFIKFDQVISEVEPFLLKTAAPR